MLTTTPTTTLTATLIKVCGLRRQADLDAADALGVDLCGFIFHAASPRCVTPGQAAALDSGRMRRVGVFVEQDAARIAAIMTLARLDYAQLHGPAQAVHAAGDTARRLADIIGPQRIIRVVWPEAFQAAPDAGAGMAAPALAEALERAAPDCGLFLLEAGTQGGGSGRPQNWSALAGLHPPRPWLVAGGLGPATLARALTACRPDGVDLNSGVEDAPGCKNHRALAAAVAIVRGTDMTGERQ